MGYKNGQLNRWAIVSRRSQTKGRDEEELRQWHRLRKRTGYESADTI
jgi:hypothetical protein